MKHEPVKQFEIASPESDTVRVLREARALVSKGWCQKVAQISYTDGTATKYCMTGAIDAATLPDREFTRTSVFYALAETLWGNIPDWNDAPERTLEEVLDAFDGAITIVQRWESLG